MINRETTNARFVKTILLVLVLLSAASVEATTYWVATDGNDANSGLDSLDAWISIGRGEELGVIAPGDTINIMPGTYSPAATIDLSTVGTLDDPVVYRAFRDETVTLDMAGQDLEIINMPGANTRVEGLELANSLKPAVAILADSCVVQYCRIHDIDDDGVTVAAKHCLIQKNQIYNIGGDGISIGEDSCRVYGNTICKSTNRGIRFETTVINGRAFNNIVVGSGEGIRGTANIVAAFNLLYSNSSSFANGVSDSAGGLEVDPMLVDLDSNDFRLELGSPAFEAGIDLGYAYTYELPDIGALEFDSSSVTGTAIFRSGTSTIPSFARFYETRFGTAQPTVDIGDWRTCQAASSPTRHEIIALGVDETVDINGLMWNESGWQGFSFNNLATVSESYWWEEDVAYEASSGDAVMVWNNGSILFNGVSYRVWDGSSWSAASAIALPCGGETQQLKLAARPFGDEMILIMSNATSQDFALVWNGSTWGNSVILDGGSGDILTDINTVYEQQSGDGMVVSAIGSTYITYRIWLGDGWDGVASLDAPGGTTGNVRWTVLGADPNSDRIVLGVLTTNQEIWLAVWDGDTWADTVSVATASNGVMYPNVAVAFEGTSGQALAAFGTTNALLYRTWNFGSGWSEADTAAITTNNPSTIILKPAPNSDEIMLGAIDAGSALSFVKWDGDSWSGRFEEETDVDEVRNQPFEFVWQEFAAANQRPVLLAVGPRSVLEDENLSFVVSATDDASIPVLTSSTLPTGATFVDNGDGTANFDWTPSFVQAGTYNVTFYATDDQLEVDSELVVITVEEAPNQLPVLAAIGAQGVTEYQTLSFVATATDAESIPEMTSSALPSGATYVDNGDGSASFEWSPVYPQAGDYQVTFYATDDSSAVDSEVVTITVTAALPTTIEIEPDSTLISADSSMQYTVTGRDASSNEVYPGTITWSLTTSLGSISGSGYYTPDLAGTTQVVAESDLGPVDTSTALVIVAGEIASINVVPDADSVVEETTLLFHAYAYDAHANLVEDLGGSAVWGTDDPSGTISATGLYTAGTDLSPPDYQVWAEYGALADTATVTVETNGELHHVRVEYADGTSVGDTSITTDDDDIVLYCRGYDSGENLLGAQTADWSAIGGTGIVQLSPSTGTSTTIEALKPGTAQVVALIGGVDADTTGTFTVTGGELASIEITPDSVRVGLGDVVQFTTTGYDSDGNEVDAGTITWDLVGWNGELDVDGRFTATRPGIARVAALSSINSLTDSTLLIAVDELLLTTLPIGDFEITPGGESSSLLTFRLDNYFDEAKTVNAIACRLALSGAGSADEMRGNIATVRLYQDADADSALSDGDVLLDEVAAASDQIGFTLTPFAIPSGNGETFLIAFQAASGPRDGDTADIYLYPDLDIQIEGGVPVAGPDSANSRGLAVYNGMIGDQIASTTTGVESLADSDVISPVAAFDFPGNGYQSDVLNGVSFVNLGSAEQSDFDSLVLAADGGNNVWDGIESEQYLGRLSFTGDRWTLTGLNAPLASGANRFYVAADLAAFPVSGRDLTLQIPVDGITVASGNDGPLDRVVYSVDTATILTSETIEAGLVTLASQHLTPGIESEPLFSLALTNGAATSVGLDSVRITVDLTANDGGSQAELESQLDSLLLYVDNDGDATSVDDTDLLVASGYVSDGKCLFELESFDLAGRGERTVLIATAAINAENARDGNLVALSLEADTNLYFAHPVATDGSFPLELDEPHVIDLFPASFATITEPSEGELSAGSKGQPVAELHLPGNGYGADALTSLNLANLGDLKSATVVTSLKLWHDVTGDGLTNDDQALGTFLSGLPERWAIGGLSQTIASGGADFVVTAEITSGQFESGVLRLQIPTSGVRYGSGLIGPDDAPVEMSTGIRVYPSDRITVISVPISTATVRPGASDLPLMSFALYNGYGGQDYSLQSVSFENGTRSQSSDQFADYELGQVSLYNDADNNRILSGDPLVASGVFINGELQFSGLKLNLAADELSYFFMTADLPLDIIDGDSLDITISGPAALSFDQSVTINGDLPLNSGGFRVVDGSIRSQFKTVAVTPGTLSPDDTDVPVFGFKPAVNGDLADFLTSLIVENLGDADSSDIAVLELWQDLDGDGQFEAEDTYLADFVPGPDNTWSASSLNVAVDSPAPTLFLVLDISSGATIGATVRFRIPIDGVGFLSQNDGPVDGPLESEDSFAISASALAVAYSPLHEDYTVGQTIALKFSATNRLASTLDGVTGRVVAYHDSAVVTADSSFDGPLSLTAGGSGEFTYYYTANQVGAIAFDVQAISTVSGDSSAVISTNEAHVKQLASDLPVSFTNSIPTAVTRGQANVFPFSLLLGNPGSEDIATVRLDSLRIAVRDSDGLPLAAYEVFDRIALSALFTTVSIVDPVPSAAEITLEFDQPLLIAAGEERRLSLLVDVDSNATATAFSVGIASASGVTVVDDNSEQSVALDPAAAFPFWTPSCRLDDPSQQMAASFVSLVTPQVNVGQKNVDILRFDLRHPGGTGSSQIQLTDITVQAADLDAQPLVFSDLVDEVNVMKRETLIGRAVSNQLEGSELDIELSSPLTLSPGESESIRLVATISTMTQTTGFRFGVVDSTALVVRDLSSGSLLEVETDTTVLVTGSAFPVWSTPAALKLQAAAPSVCLESMLPASTVGGADSLALAELTIVYPVSPEHSSLCTDRILVTFTDTTGVALNPDNLFDRIGFIDPDGQWQYQQFVLTQTGSARFDLGEEGTIIAPGDSATITLVGDIAMGSSITNFMLTVESAVDVGLFDATDTSFHPQLAAGGECWTALPFIAPVTYVYQPAGQPTLDWRPLPVELVYRGQSDVPLFVADFEYDNDLLQGDLSLESFGAQLLKRGDTGLTGIREDALFENIYLYLNDQLVATDHDLTDDTLLMVFDAAQSLSQGEVVSLSLRGDLLVTAPEGNYVVQCADSSFITMTDANLATAVYPAIQSGAYPLSSHELSLSVAGLEGSLTNYPNPFYPEESATTIGYVLDRPGRVDIDLFSITGDLVNNLVANEPRPAGPNSVDTWLGQNGAGELVAPGTYFCRLTVRYDDGTEEVVRRKVAVIR